MRISDWSSDVCSSDLLAGTYPAILDDAVVGESARGLWKDAQAMLDRVVAEKWLTAKAVAGLWPCRREIDDVVVTEQTTDGPRDIRIPFLRQQIAKREGRDRKSTRMNSSH